MPYPDWRTLQSYSPTAPSARAWRQLQNAPTTPEPLYGGGGFAGTWSNAGYRTPYRPMPTQQPAVRTQAEIEQRINLLVSRGLIDPSQLLDENNNVRPEIWQQIDRVGPYSGLPEQDLALTGSPVPDALLGTNGDQTGYPNGDAYGGNGYTFLNPEEIQNDQWTRNFSALRANEQVTRSGYYWDEATKSWRVTAERADQLLGRFGNANVAEAQYRQQVANAQNTAGAGYQGVQQAQAAYNNVAGDVRMTGGGYNPTGEQQAAQLAAGNAVNQAQMAYNRARGLAGQVQKPIGLDQLARGMTPEMFGQYAQAVGPAYTGEEWDALQKNPAQYAKDPRFAPALAYRRVNLARGGL